MRHPNYNRFKLSNKINTKKISPSNKKLKNVKRRKHRILKKIDLKSKMLLRRRR